MLNTATLHALFSVAASAGRLLSKARLYRDEATTEAQLQRGDHLRVARVRCGGLFRYTHHGIYLGNGQVAHYAGYASDDDTPDAGGDCIEIVSLREFADGRPLFVRKYRNAFHADIIINRALSRLGEDRYCLFRRNCEHFASWCSIGKSRSTQVRRGYTMSSTGVSGLGGMAAFKQTVLQTGEHLLTASSDLLYSLPALLVG